jgi:hypothetical protein
MHVSPSGFNVPGFSRPGKPVAALALFYVYEGDTIRVGFAKQFEITWLRLH